MTDMAGDHRDFPADIEPEELKEAGDALEGLIMTVMDNLVGEYFLQQAERQVVTYPVVIICPGRILNVYGTFVKTEEADRWVDLKHFTKDTCFAGNSCANGVDYDMHVAVGMEWPDDPHGR